ncbi:proteasome assembly chaperone family protein [Acidipropionibacterium thoenii]|uniref:proteasome assembly chaperone family protein n=1 Tax=Acidipropionibacterium thoenii TaxID=1751 RepID=UPI00055FDA16|nr:PAC2 family protein [Acidipropionibacterium thoenii]
MARHSSDRPWVIVGYTGWNDAGGAASETAARVIRHTDATEWRVLDSEDYYNFQDTRPVVAAMEGIELITWPATTIWKGQSEGRTVVVVTGPEPDMRWRSYCRELLDTLTRLDPVGIVVLGGMVADVPHTRQLPVSGSASHHDLAEQLGLEGMDYTGPTGIPGVLVSLAADRGMNAVGLWANVPEYAYEPPCPPAVQSLLVRVEELTGMSVPQEDLVESRQKWVSDADQMVTDNDTLSDYVHALERQRDAELPEGITGDVIAMEFQHYLRHRS